MNERVEMTVKLRVTRPQALALEAMFHYWNRLSCIGSSRYVTFFVDGDGNFHPKVTIQYDKEVPELTDEIMKLAEVKDNNGDKTFDFDPVAWKIDHER